MMAYNALKTRWLYILGAGREQTMKYKVVRRIAYKSLRLLGMGMRQLMQYHNWSIEEDRK